MADKPKDPPADNGDRGGRSTEQTRRDAERVRRDPPPPPPGGGDG